MQVGVDKMHKDTKYVLFLDDDVRLHPGSIGALTAEMEKNPDVWFFKLTPKYHLFEFFGILFIYFLYAIFFAVYFCYGYLIKKNCYGYGALV